MRRHLQWRFQRNWKRELEDYVSPEVVERAKRQPIGEDDDIFNEPPSLTACRPSTAVPAGTFGWDGEEPTVPLPPPEAPEPCVDLDCLRIQRLAQGEGVELNVPGGRDIDTAAMVASGMSLQDLQDKVKDAEKSTLPDERKGITPS